MGSAYQVNDLLIVDLQVVALDEVFQIGVLCLPLMDLLEELLEDPGDETPLAALAELVEPFPLHRVGLPRPRLAIGEDTGVVA